MNEHKVQMLTATVPEPEARPFKTSQKPGLWHRQNRLVLGARDLRSPTEEGARCKD